MPSVARLAAALGHDTDDADQDGGDDDPRDNGLSTHGETVSMMWAVVASRHAVAREMAGSLLIGGSLVLVMLQESLSDPPQNIETLIDLVVYMLAAGGVGWLLIRTWASEYAKRQDAQREAAVAEREEERVERERMFQHWVTRINDLNKVNADLMASYVAREARVEQHLLAQIEAWRTACESERERSDTTIAQMIQRMSCTVPPPEET